MPVSPGTRIGAYEVTALLGSGGMGEVYRARDTKLNRDVALKVLADEFALDPDRLTRFKREAQLLASLNHPNIAAIYGFEEGTVVGAGPPSPKASASRLGGALILELVEGPTLADRIAHGPLPWDEALPIARQIADALEAAHEHGIVHRDLKPANIKVREDGTVKVLDFGLAKALERETASVDASMSPTVTAAATQLGTILGTAAYMAPEQARGNPVDRRADIWAFGCVLYEMLTGKRAFEGQEVSDTLAAILRDEPDLSKVPNDARRLLRACIEKDRHQRLQSIGDFRLLLDERATSPVREQRRPTIWIATAVVSALVAAVVGAMQLFESAPVEQARQLQVALPSNSRVYELALSADGRQFVIGLNTGLEGRATELWLRSFDQPDLQRLGGTTGARIPFWSPDGRFIGFFADGKLKTIPAGGGPADMLCDAGGGGGATWNHDGVILFASESGSLQRVRAFARDCTAVLNADGDRRFRFPVFLPDGNHFLYVVTGGDEAGRGLHLAALDDLAPRRLLSDQSSAIFAPSAPGSMRGHLLFLRDNVLMALPFDGSRLTASGDAIPVAKDASFNLMAPQLAASAAADGTLVYLTSPPRSFQLTWFDRSGQQRGRLGTPQDERHVAFSPDERNIAKVRANDVWVHDITRDVDTRFATQASSPVWSPDGSRLAFASGNDLYVQEAGGGRREPLVLNDNPKRLSDWSATGGALVYTEIDPKTRADIWILPEPKHAQDEREPVSFLRTEFQESQARISRDGRWIAYTSDESGIVEVYVRPFPSGLGKWRISGRGGQDPSWRADGRELFYLESAGPGKRMIAVPITQGQGQRLDVGAARTLFEFPVLVQFIRLNEFVYSPAADGTRFLVNLQVSDNQPTLNVITNWQQLLSPTGR